VAVIPRVLIIVSLLFASLTLVAGNAAAQRGCNQDVFATEWTQQVDSRVGDLAITASVYDTRTSCWYEFEPSLVLTTASAVKLQVLAANLDRVETAGRDFTANERAHAQRMLWFSHNSPSTSALYGSVGTSGMQRFSAAVGADSTRHSSIYGVTSGPARDFTRVALATLDLGAPSPLTVRSRRVARDLLSDVHFTQRWGISAGLPADHEVWLKNGFFPCTGCRPFVGVYSWRIASTGFVERPDGTGWAITVMTDGAKDHSQGSDVVELFASHVAEYLRDGQADARPVDRSNCVTAQGAESPSSITRRLQLPSSSWSDVRWVSGNEGPLRGQLLCGRKPLARVSPCICPERPLRQ
jgi:hypothetical protein